eukprot:CAMPEP_0196591030 /NCGR_PEP_ID=MMETSP1081-20130531/68303_1 /TAXON_ID=36882 /ORGANISM="Pyramimonas amylifera, Strain CCMP720" /LENGTH=376 /DNA_ID=CAMNT_0041914281 /DNA_START=223 /DNA_END=1353 /DNA_ORIENTATION=-
MIQPFQVYAVLFNFRKDASHINNNKNRQYRRRIVTIKAAGGRDGGSYGVPLPSWASEKVKKQVAGQEDLNSTPSSTSSSTSPSKPSGNLRTRPPQKSKTPLGIAPIKKSSLLPLREDSKEKAELEALLKATNPNMQNFSAGESPKSTKEPPRTTTTPPGRSFIPMAPAGMPAGITAGGGMSQVRVYEQLLALRQRMASRLSETNRYARFLENELHQRDVQVKACRSRMKLLGQESATLARQCQEMSNSINFGIVEKNTLSSKLQQMNQRLDSLQTLLKQDIEGLDALSLQEMPVSWIGVAQEVKLMGSFDNWTRGLELSAEDYTFSGEQTFSGTLELLPGQYEVKFFVDGKWLLGPGWPETEPVEGVSNNIITVAM